jgi:putative heme-binding domain-containing protein
MEKGLAGQPVSNLPASLKAWLDNAWPKQDPDQLLLCFALRLGDARAQTAAVRFISDAGKAEGDRARVIEILGERGDHSITSYRAGSESGAPVRELLAICDESKSSALRTAALNALRHFPDPDIGEHLVALFPKANAELQPQIVDALSSRPGWSELLVRAVEDARIKPSQVSRAQARQMGGFKDAGLSKRIEKLWGRTQSESPAEKQNFINRAKLVLKPSGLVGRVPTPDLVRGKKLFQENCGVCHQLYGEGQTIGPDLTSADRKNTDFLLANIVAPSAYIRPEYIAYDLETTDDQSLSGLMAESSPAAVTLVDRTNQRHTIPRSRVRQLRESPVSLMPEGLLENLQPQQLIDLFGYLQAK